MHTLLFRTQILGESAVSGAGSPLWSSRHFVNCSRHLALARVLRTGSRRAGAHNLRSRPTAPRTPLIPLAPGPPLEAPRRRHHSRRRRHCPSHTRMCMPTQAAATPISEGGGRAGAGESSGSDNVAAKTVAVAAAGAQPPTHPPGGLGWRHGRQPAHTNDHLSIFSNSF